MRFDRLRRIGAFLTTVVALAALLIVMPASVATTTAAPTVRSVSTGATSAYGGSTSQTVPVPAGAAPGDVLVGVATAPVAPAGLSTPAGWSRVRLDDNGSGVETAVFVHVVGTSEPASYTWSFDRTNVAVVVMAVSGVDTTDPVDASAAAFADYTSTVVAPSLTTTSADDLLVLFVGNQGGSGAAPQASMTKNGDVVSGDLYCCNVSSHVATQALGAAGATGTRTATLDINYVEATGTALALRPAGATTTSSTTTTVPPPTTTTVPPTTTSVPPTSTSSTSTTVAQFIFTVFWQGQQVNIVPVRNVDMGNYHDRQFQGVATGFFTNDPAYRSLDGSSIDVWSASKEFGGELVLNNSLQSSEPKGTWTFGS